MWTALRHAREAACGFARRHRRVIIAATVGAAAVGGAVYAYRRVVSKAERFSRQLQRQLAEHQRLQLALRSTTDESAAAVRRFLPRLRARLYALTDLERVVAELKAGRKGDRARRNELWEDAKRLALTRYLTALLAFALWHLLVFAQLAVIGKRVFERTRDGDGAASASATEDEDKAHHAFLASGLEYFLDEALDRIKDHVERAVADSQLLQSWQVAKKASVPRDELNTLLQSLFADVMPTISPDGAPADEEREEQELRKWRAFLIYPDKKRGQSEQVISLLNDLWDLLESDLFAPALLHSLGFLCGNAFQDLNDVVYGAKHGDDAMTPAPAPALAKLIPCLQAEVGKLLQTTGPDSYVNKYSHGVGEMEAFRNFYEAIFFQPDEAVGMQFI